MSYTTDERLKGYLDTNQLQRERMCLAILAIDKRYTNVRPRHPRGGPDGGRDIDATFAGEQQAIGAIGFVNQANDSADHKRKAKKKFSDDLKSARSSEPDLKAFVFFTNVNLTASEKDALIQEAKSQGLAHCEIMDRERMRLVLDGADGLSIRFQALGIPMSEAEQATFFARWGDDIQSVIADGFGEVKKALSLAYHYRTRARRSDIAASTSPTHWKLILYSDRWTPLRSPAVSSAIKTNLPRYSRNPASRSDVSTRRRPIKASSRLSRFRKPIFAVACL